MDRGDYHRGWGQMKGLGETCHSWESHGSVHMLTKDRTFSNEVTGVHIPNGFY